MMAEMETMMYVTVPWTKPDAAEPMHDIDRLNRILWTRTGSRVSEIRFHPSLCKILWKCEQFRDVFRCHADIARDMSKEDLDEYLENDTDENLVGFLQWLMGEPMEVDPRMRRPKVSVILDAAMPKEIVRFTTGDVSRGRAERFSVDLHVVF